MRFLHPTGSHKADEQTPFFEHVRMTETSTFFPDLDNTDFLTN
jgi:hypothetical protein